jgi:hypothetical protein
MDLLSRSGDIALVFLVAMILAGLILGIGWTLWSLWTDD